MLRRGTFSGSNAVIIFGGHEDPMSTVGIKLLWKNAQKNERKNRTSEAMNKIIPILNPFSTNLPCSPFRLASREASRHH